MAFAQKLVAQGQMAAADGSLYTPGGSVQASGVYLYLYNTNTTTETVLVDLTLSGGTKRRIWSGSLLTLTAASIFVPYMTGADDLRGSTTTAAKVDFVVAAMTQ